ASPAPSRIELRRRRELLEQLSLSSAQSLRDVDHHDRVEVAGRPSAARQALATQPQPAAARGSRRNLDPGAAVKRRNRYVGAEGRLPWRHGKIHVEIAPL